MSGDTGTVQQIYSSIAAPKAALLFKIDWSTLISVFGAHTTTISITVTVIVAHKRSPPSPDLCHHPPHPSIIALLPRHPPSLTANYVAWFRDLLCSSYSGRCWRSCPYCIFAVLWCNYVALTIIIIGSKVYCPLEELKPLPFDLSAVVLAGPAE